MQMKQAELETKIKVAEIDANALLESTRMKIEGGQETQDYRQKHDSNMEMLKASNQSAMNRESAENQVQQDVAKKTIEEMESGDSRNPNKE